MKTRLRVAFYAVLVAAVPVGLGAFAIANQATENEVDKADASLNAMLRAAEAEFAEIRLEARTRAERLAAAPPVQRALESGDEETLARFARSRPGVSFVRGTSLVGPPAAGLSVQEMVEVFANEEMLGHLVVTVPIDDRFLQRLSRTAVVPPGDELVVTKEGRIVRGSRELAGGTAALAPYAAGDVTLGGESYRALVGRPVLEKQQGVKLALLRPRDPIDAAADRTWWRVLLGALGTLGAVALLASLLAPALARGRLSQRQRAQAARVLTHVGDGIVMVDHEGVVRFWNPAGEAITGLGADAVVGRPLVEAIPAWKTIADLVPVARAADTRDRPSAKTVPLDLGGRELWISVSGVEFEEGTVYSFRDLTEERQLDDLKTDFVTTVSHELKTPVASVYGAAMTLQGRDSGLTDEKRSELLTVIYEQADRLARLIDDILVAGQLGSGKLRVARHSFDPAALARSVVEEIPATLLDGRQVDLRADDSMPAVSGDSAKARQILANLVDNAIKYSPGNGRIQISVDRSGSYARFSVRDEGDGIPPGQEHRIFEKFYRLDPHMREGIGGTGLGLYICRELVRHMRGRIWVTSHPGAGATFSFELPLAEVAPPAEPEREPAGAGVEAKRS